MTPYLIPPSDQRADLQNQFVQKALQAFQQNNAVALEAPTGFGKTFISLAIAKNWALERKQKVLIATAATNHTVNFWKDHLKQENQQESGISLSFLVGKANPSFKPCAFIDEWSNPKGKETKQEESVYALCDRKKELDDCAYYLNLFQEGNDNEKTLSILGQTECQATQTVLSNPQLQDPEQKLLQTIEGLKQKHLCPYYALKNNFSNAQIQVCDYQYLIQPRYLEEKTNDYLLVIDEFDKFEERLKEQFKIDLSQAMVGNVLFDLESREKQLFKQTFDKLETPEQKLFFKAFAQYASMLTDFFSSISNKAKNEKPVGLDLDKTFFGNPIYKDGHERFKEFFVHAEEELLKLYNNPFQRKNPYRHLVAFFYRLEQSEQQKDAISFVDSLQKRPRGLVEELVVNRKPLLFASFYESLCKRFEKVLVMSATLPFQEMLEIGFNQKIELLQIPKQWGLTGKKEGIVLKSPFFVFSNRQRNRFLPVKTQMLVDLLDELSTVRNEIVVFFNSYSSLRPMQEQLFAELQKKGFQLFLDEEKKDSPENRDALWQQFQQTDGKKIMFSTMFTKYARGSNLLRDDGCRILLLIGIPYPRVYDFELKKFNEMAQKQRWGIDAETWHFILTTRKVFTQAAGRLTRHQADYGFFAVLSDDSLDRILDKEHKELLDIHGETLFTQTISDKAKRFFETLPDKA